ncbi:MAG: hypothetical protein Crog4KO_25120 [Crocinitomicaceae bacterium]
MKALTINATFLSKGVVILLLLLFSFEGMGQTCMEVVGYYPNWQWYDRNKLVNPQSIDYSKYSILNYCFFKPEADGSISSHDAWADENLLLGQPDWQNGGYIPGTSIVYQAHSNGVKILPSIGGWTLSGNFPSIAADPVKRATFAQSCVDLIQTYGFDGIDLDWEYPGFVPHNGTPQDKANFNLLLADIRTAIDNYGISIGQDMLLTAAVGAGQDKMENVDWPVASNYLDIINIMSYDFFGSWDATANHNSPLFAPQQGDPQFNLAWSVDQLVNNYNVDPNKITAGVAFYGRSAKTTGAPDLFSPITGQLDLATFPEDEGTPLYYNVLLKSSQFDEHWDATAKVPYMNGKNGLNTFLSYDNEASIEQKAQFIVDNELRGAIIWEITGDYIETAPGSGIISATPLATTLNDVFCNYNPNTNSVDENQLDNVAVFPNPSSGMCTLTGTETTEVQVSNVHGQLVQSLVLSDTTFELDAALPNGIYILSFSSEERRIYKKVVLER